MSYLKNMKKSLFAVYLLIGTMFSPVAVASDSANRSLDTHVSQQASIIKGTVLDSNGEPVIGASILVKGTSTGTITNLDGFFSLEAPIGSTLVISYIGYATQEVLADKAELVLRLKEDTQFLDEIVVVGYGVQKRESLTGSMQTLDNKKLTDVTSPSVQNMLSGKAPGVYVAPGSGRPGAEGTVIIRGKASINGSTNPLWVIDGVIVGNSANNTLNPADIETMTILKDAASTAIYGSQGANGVVVVTTKKGKSEKFTISASAKVGWNTLSNGKLEVMNGAELFDYYKSFNNQEMITFSRWNDDLRNSNYDWWDTATQTGIAQDYNVSISGGSDINRSFFSVGIYDESGAVKGYDYRRYNFRYRNEYKPVKWLTIKPLISASKRDISDKERSVTSMYSNLPWDSPYLEDGTPTPHKSKTWVNSNATNYLYDLQWNRAKSNTHSFMGNLDFDVRFTDWLTFSSINSYVWEDFAYKNYIDPRSNNGSGVDGRLEEQNRKTRRMYTNQIIRFNKAFGKHSINALAAYEFNDYKFKFLQAIGTGFVAGFDELDVTAIPEKTAGYTRRDVVQSYLFNGNYAYDSKYLAQVSFRRDGASNFGTNAQYGNFFSVSGGWLINREEFFKADWVDQLKLRMSYGSVGNRPNEYFPQYGLYTVNSSYNGKPGALLSSIENKGLTWEKTYTFGVGLDVSLFDRFRLNLDYYRKNTDNVLFKVPVSGITGITSYWQNIGEVENNGFELSLSADIIKNNDWYWSVDYNVGLNRNKIKKLYGRDPQIIQTNFGGPAGSISRILRIGEDIDTFYGREWAGVNPENGAPQWYKTVKDASGYETRELTSTYAEADEVMLGAMTPDFFGGFSTNLAWKNIDMNATFTYSVGGKIYNYSRQEYDSDGAYTDRNQMKLKSGWSRWEKPGDIATHPVPSYNNKSNSNKVSSRYIEDSDYLKMRSLTIGYNLKLPKYNISNMRLFFSAENLFTITSYSGVDPEIPVKENTANQENTDNSASVVNVVGASVYPLTRKFMFGINITL